MPMLSVWSMANDSPAIGAHHELAATRSADVHVLRELLEEHAR